MHDTASERPNNLRLFQIASEQHGYFTAAQARTSGFRGNLLAHHTRAGRFLHIAPGIYRIRDYPTSSHDEVVVAWLAAGKQVAWCPTRALSICSI